MTDLNTLVQQVGAWHVSTYGTGDLTEALLAKLAEEVDELDEAIVLLPRTAFVGREMADVLIVLAALAYREGIDLPAEVAAKFAVVQARDQRARDIERGIELPEVVQ